jgi:hypothetical protein
MKFPVSNIEGKMLSKAGGRHRHACFASKIIVRYIYELRAIYDNRRFIDILLIQFTKVFIIRYFINYSFSPLGLLIIFICHADGRIHPNMLASRTKSDYDYLLIIWG